eukprot:SAG31_NODE_45408_length_259_cov_0.631250_1_plen_45_part_01
MLGPLWLWFSCANNGGRPVLAVRIRSRIPELRGLIEVGPAEVARR